MSEHGAATDPNPPTEPPMERPPYRRLTRRRDDKVIAGVAAGLADYFGVDPVLFRVAFVVLAFAGGSGLLLYGVAWLLMPVGPSQPTSGPHRDRWEPVERAVNRLRGAPTWVGVVLLIAGAAVFANQFGLWSPGIFWGVALIGLGVLLFVQEGRGERTTISAPPGPPQRLEADPGGSAPMGSEWAPAAPLPPVIPDAPPKKHERTPKERSPLGLITLGTMVLAVGLAAALDGAGVVHLAPGRYFALALTVVGLGLVAGAWWGRARGMIVLGLLLIPFVLVASLIDVPFAGGTGQRAYRPVTVAAARSPYRLVAGEMRIDLTQVPLSTAEPLTVTATVVAGRVVVIVPADLSVDVHGRVGAGEIDLFGQRTDGLSVSDDRSFPPSTAFGHLVLNLEVSFGQVSVIHVATGEELR